MAPSILRLGTQCFGIYDDLNTTFLTSGLDELSLDRFNDTDTEYPELIINNFEFDSKSGVQTLNVSGVATDNEEIEYVYFTFHNNEYFFNLY